MTFPITLPSRPAIGTPEVTLIEANAQKQELEFDSPGPGGVLKELALARWGGLTTEKSQPPQRDDHQDQVNPIRFLLSKE